MDASNLSDLSNLAPLFTEKAGIAALGALAIWAGVRVVSVVINALRDVELARTEVQKTLAAALQSQATTAATLVAAQGEARRDSVEQAIVLRMIAGRVGLVEQQNAGTGETHGAQ